MEKNNILICCQFCEQKKQLQKIKFVNVDKNYFHVTAYNFPLKVSKSNYFTRENQIFQMV